MSIRLFIPVFNGKNIGLLQKVICISLFLLCSLSLCAQDYCKKTSIYFEMNKAEIQLSENVKLEHIIQEFKGSEFLIELYGYADTSASSEYNMKLSQNRINSVRNYFVANSKLKFKFFEKNLGEEETDKNSPNMESFRKVDIYVFLITDNLIKVGNASESMEVPTDYFEPCGACNSKPSIKSFYNEADANAANIELKTTDGLDLITAGSFDFDFLACDDSKANKGEEEICLTVKADVIDTEMTVWDADTINGVIYWKPSESQPIFDLVNKTYKFCYKGGFTNLDRLKNLDKPKIGHSNLFIFPLGFDTYKSEVSVQQNLAGTKSYNDSINVGKGNYIFSFITKEDRLYYLSRDFSKLIPISIDTIIFGRSYIVRSTYVLDFSYYKEFEFTDKDLKIKHRKKPGDIGFYISEVKEFAPIKKGDNRKYSIILKPKEEFELAYFKRNKLYVIPYKHVKLKYKKRKDFYKLKMNKKTLSKFRRNKEFSVKNQEWSDYTQWPPKNED